MKRLGLILVALGLAGGLGAFNMDTSVEAGGQTIGTHQVPKSRVINLGLMDDRRNFLYASGLGILVGVILFGFGSIQQKISAVPAQVTEPNDKVTVAIVSAITVLSLIGAIVWYATQGRIGTQEQAPPVDTPRKPSVGQVAAGIPESLSTTIRRKCVSQWPTDLKTQAYCESQQYEGYKSLDPSSRRSAYCAELWPDDYRMRRYCESQN